MSRIGKVPVIIPEKIKATISGQTVSVEGPQGKLTKEFPDVVSITMDKDAIHVAPKGDSRAAALMHGTTRAIINNMIKGVSEGYKKQLEIQGVGFKAILKGDILDLALGQSHPILYKLPAGVKVVITDGVKIDVTGPDKQMVGQVAADIKSYKPVEPYKGKGVRIVGEFVRRKEGKKTA